ADEATPSSGSASASGEHAQSAAPYELRWEGASKAGASGLVAHYSETEAVAGPLARSGFALDVPEGTTSLLFRLTWEPDGEEHHVMVHGPHAAGDPMPTYMRRWSTTGEDCFAVPAQEIVPGPWKVMVHSHAEAPAFAFLVTVVSTGARAPAVSDGPHGYPATDEFNMEEREILPCGGE
ncbi:MAG: hypothetical protein ACT4PT_11635, partial [Methanobacteriota archaeon]